MARIFISHSSKDPEQAARLLTWLHAQGFTSTFLDFDKDVGIAPGAEWERTLYSQLSGADSVILILTSNWFASKWCFVEFAQARALGKAIFSLIETPVGETFVSADIQPLDLTLDREGGLNHLRTELTQLAMSVRGSFPWDLTRPPFPGLLSFDEPDAAIYFGRDEDVTRLIEHLNARRAQGGEKFLIVLGSSGSGKSSLLRAGVLPRLKRDPRNWIVLPPFRPQSQPLEELAQVAAAATGNPTSWRHWRDAFLSPDLTAVLAELVEQIRSNARQPQAQILLTIDQGEELFSTRDSVSVKAFLRLLNMLLTSSLSLIVVMTLRSDYLARLQQETELTVPFEQFLLQPMPLDRIRDIIVQPAALAGLSVDETFVTEALADARTTDALPLLAFVLRELYDRSASGSSLSVEGYRALGDAQSGLSPLENCVRRKADEILASAKPSAEDLSALKDALIPAMVRVNPDGEFVRRTGVIASFPPRSLPLVELFVKGRLLTTRVEGDQSTVEVAHEALLRNWPLLLGWLEEERDFLVGKDRLESDALDWDRAPEKKKAQFGLTGLRLTQAEAWLKSKPRHLSDLEKNFIRASVRAQRSGSFWPVFWMVLVILLGLAALIGLLILFLIYNPIGEID